MTTVQCPGVQEGAAETLVLDQGALHYLSPEGIMRYDGSLPMPIGQKLGSVRYQAGAAGTAGGLLWFALSDAKGQKALFTWDTERELWHREDALPVMQFAADGGTLYALTQTGELWAMGREDDPYAGHKGQEQQVEWSAETGEIGLYDADNRFISRLSIRLTGKVGAKIQVFASWDDGEWQLLMSRVLTREQTLLLPILPRRCSRMRLKLTGVGDVKLHSITKLQEQGSEL